MYSSIKKAAVVFGVAAVSFFGLTSPIFAHVVVKPAEIGIGKFQTFTLGAPVEKPIAATQIRLVIPDGLNYVTPNVKPGWEIEIKKTGEGEEAKVTEIIWKGGKIPASQRDEFLFSAQTPAKETVLKWKAYQTYEDGTVVNWDMEPKADSHDDESQTPYSTTEVVNDLSGDSSMDGHSMGAQSSVNNGFTSNPFAAAASILSVIALAVSLGVMAKMKK